MSYSLCNDLYPDPPCPDTRDNNTLIEWMATTPYPGACAYTTLQGAAVVFGASSILIWVVVTAPQMLENYRTKRADSLSIWFLAQWFAGDITNLIGCFLAKQEASQTWLAIYHVFQDIVLLLQYLYYNFVYPRFHGYEEVPIEDDTDAYYGTTNNNDDVASNDSRDALVKPTRQLSHRQLREKRRSIMEAVKSVRGANGTSPSGGSPGNLSASFDGMPSTTVQTTTTEEVDTDFPAPFTTEDPPAAASSSNGAVLKATAALLGVATIFANVALVQQHPATVGSKLGAVAARRLLQVGAADDVFELGVEVPEAGSSEVPEDSDDMSEESYYIGLAVGWVSAAFYLGSRLPQVVRNFKRGTTEGLSPLMFSMSLMGNVTYFLGIILLDSSLDSVLCHLPWVVGSLGTIQFDMILLLQFLYYRRKSEIEARNAVPAKSGLRLNALEDPPKKETTF